MDDICHEATTLVINRVDKMMLNNQQKVAAVLIIMGAMKSKCEETVGIKKEEDATFKCYEKVLKSTLSTGIEFAKEFKPGLKGDMLFPIPNTERI